MKKERLAYEAPTSEALELRFEGVICQSGDVEIIDWQDDGNQLTF